MWAAPLSYRTGFGGLLDEIQRAGHIRWPRMTAKGGHKQWKTKSSKLLQVSI